MPTFLLQANAIATIHSHLMSPFVCEKCGAELLLSLPDNAYLCESSPKEHRFDRGTAEQAWLQEASKSVEAAPGDVDAAFQLASLCGRLAAASLRVGDRDPARVYMGQVVGITEMLYEGRKDDERVRAMLMEALLEQATVGEKINDQGMAASAYERLLPFVRAEAQASRKDAGMQRNLSACLNSAGRMRRALGDGVGAMHLFKEDLEVVQRTAELYPESDELQFDLAVAHFNLFLVSTVRSEEREHLEAVLEILKGRAQLPDQAKQLEQRARTELERIDNTDEMAPARLAKATADIARGKQDDSSSPAELRAWLIDQVETVLKNRRKRLAIIR